MKDKAKHAAKTPTDRTHDPDSDPQVPPADLRQQLGREGERLAEQFLRRRGLKLVTRHFSSPVGELDLVMRDGDTVVFVEVKTRRDRSMADPEDAIGYGKRRRLVRAARWFVRHKHWDDRPCRFDVVALVLPTAGAAEIEHLPEAFVPHA